MEEREAPPLEQREQLIADMWRITEAFFAQDEAVKVPVQRTVDNPFGYWDRELTKRKRDHKEVFDYADPSGPTGHLNRWPAGHDEFRTTLIEFYDTFSQLATDTLGVIRDALGLGARAHHEEAACDDHRGHADAPERRGEGRLQQHAGLPARARRGHLE